MDPEIGVSGLTASRSSELTDRDPPASPPDPATRSISRRIWTLSLCRFAEAISIGMLIPVLPAFISSLVDTKVAPFPGWSEFLVSIAGADTARHFDLGTAEAKTAALFSLAGFAMAGIQILSGRLSDAFDIRKPIILIGMTGGMVCSAGYVWVSSYPGLLGLRVVQGLFLGLTFPPLMAIVAHYSPAGRGGTTLGIYTTIRLLGFAAGPLIGGALLEAFDFPTVFLTSATLLLSSIALVALLIPEHKNRPDTARNGGPDSNLSKRASRREARKNRERIPVPFSLRILGGGIFFMMIGVSGIISLFPTYQREFGATAREMGFVFSAFLGTRFLLQFAMGSLGDRWDKKKLLFWSLLALGPTVALQGWVQSLDQLIFLRVILGVSVAAISSSVSGIAADRSQPGNRARVMGVNTFSFSLGVAVGPLLSGFIPNPRIAFAIPGGATLLLAGLILAAVPSDRSVRTQPRPGVG